VFLADLGFSSNQMDDGARGFSFMRDGPLDMRLDPTLPVSAADLVNSSSVGELERVLREFGEERQAGRIVRAIVEARRVEPIRTTGGLKDVIHGAIGRGGGGIDSATRTFQALRIAVNDEIGVLDGLLSFLSRPAGWLAPGARFGIISFHSLEDRPVKQHFAAMERDGAIARNVGPVVADSAEVTANPRSRSAKLRVATISTR
jgi:16S rRNA (cytosine1402-N4)-methyltransferase